MADTPDAYRKPQDLRTADRLAFHAHSPRLGGLMVALFAGLATTGCATYCQQETYNRISPATHTTGVESYTDDPRQTIVKLADGVTFTLRSCYERRVCIDIDLPEGRRMQFQSSQLTELDAKESRALKLHALPPIHFSVHCEEDRGTPRICSSSELPPTSAPVEVKTYPKSQHDTWMHQLFWKTFSSDAEFVGAEEIRGSLTRRWLSRTANRTYEMRIYLDPQPTTNPYLLRFPKVTIDGTSYQLPDIRVSTVREEVCRSPSP